MRIAADLVLPANAVTQTFAFLARRGAGKTYAASVLAEGMLQSHAQIVAIDPVGVWYGLRIAADGKGAGFDIPIFGGSHGDVPLEPTGGALIADLIVERGISAVLDVSEFRKNDRKRFATDFAEELFHRKKAARSPLHIFIEEAQVFIPQRVQTDEARMLGAFEDLVKLGRNFGVGVTLISQRPQAVNKDALNQTEALFVLQTNGAQERKALEAWITEQGVASKSVVDELPALPIGTAYLWSPSWLRVFKKVRINKRVTYDASATPVGGQATRIEPRPLTADELAQVREAMKATIERVKADDPKALRIRILALERELQEKPAPLATIERVEVPTLREGELEQALGLMNELMKLEDRVSAAAKAIGSAVGRTLQYAEDRRVQAERTPRPLPVTATVTRTSSNAASMGRGERIVLSGIAQHQNGVTREQLTVLTGYKRSTRDAYIQRLGVAGYIEVTDRIRVTREGITALGSDYEPLPTGAALREHWVARLPQGERAVLEILVQAWPNAVARDAISEATGYARSSRDAYIQRLQARELVRSSSDGVLASEVLFQ